MRALGLARTLQRVGRAHSRANSSPTSTWQNLAEGWAPMSTSTSAVSSSSSSSNSTSTSTSNSAQASFAGTASRATTMAMTATTPARAVSKRDVKEAGNVWSADAAGAAPATSRKGARGPPTRWQRIQEALIPYRVGLRKFLTNVGVAYDLIKWSLVDLDRKLTRRERRLVLKTVLDLLKLVPFAIIAAAPGGSLLLPVLARYMPSTLPTTFNMPSRTELEKIVQTSERETSLKRRMDRELKGAIERMVSSMHTNQVSYYKEVRELLEEATQAESLGEETSPLKMSRFSDADLLDILNMQQLELIAAYFKLPLPGAMRAHVVGATAFVDSYRFSMLRYQLSRYAAKLTADDVILVEENVNKLSDEELRQTCEARGLIITSSLDPPLSSMAPESREEMLASLNLWLLASVGRHVPVVLLAFRNLDASAPGISMEESAKDANA